MSRLNQDNYYALLPGNRKRFAFKPTGGGHVSHQPPPRKTLVAVGPTSASRKPGRRRRRGTSPTGGGVGWSDSTWIGWGVRLSFKLPAGPTAA